MTDGDKAHSTQKPEALLHRVILLRPSRAMSCSIRFSAPARRARWRRRLGRHFIGIERDAKYAQHRAHAHRRYRTGRQATPSKSPSPSAPSRAFPSAGLSSAGCCRRERCCMARRNIIAPRCAPTARWSARTRPARSIASPRMCRAWMPAMAGRSGSYEASKGNLVPIDVLRQRVRASDQRLTVRAR